MLTLKLIELIVTPFDFLVSLQKVELCVGERTWLQFLIVVTCCDLSLTLLLEKVFFQLSLQCSLLVDKLFHLA